jgi:hypothetical protein
LHTWRAAQWFLSLLQFCGAVPNIIVHRQNEDEMIREAEILEWAETYREMARKAFDPALRIEFSDRAERYEIVARAVKRKRTDAG